jgi:hypothetical protein
MTTKSYPLGKKNTYEAVRLVVWLWPDLHAEKWEHKLICGHLLSQATHNLLPSQATSTAAESWHMTIAMMLNGTEKIYGDPDPFNTESGLSSELQAWRLLTLMSFAFLNSEARVAGNLGRITLNKLDIRVANRSDFHQTNQGLGADAIHYLNHEGLGNSIVWFKSLDLKNYQTALSDRLIELLKIWQECIALFGQVLPITSLFSSHLTRHKLALITLENAVPKMIPKALSNLAQMMEPLQDSIPLAAQKQLGEKAKLNYRLKVTDDLQTNKSRFDKKALLELLGATTQLFETKNLKPINVAEEKL